MINFYRYIHTSLSSRQSNESIIWPQHAVDAVAKYTSKDLLYFISGYRQQLLLRNVGAGTRVLLAMPVSIAVINAILAVQSIGAIPVLPPVKPGFLTLLTIIRKLRIHTVITTKKPGLFIHLLFNAAGIQCLQMNNTNVEFAEWKPVAVPADRAALITHSSGSTGKPKAIYRSHGVLSAQHLVLKKLFPPSAGQRDFPLFPNIILHNLACGVTSVLPLIKDFQLEHLNPSIIVDQMHSQRIETLTGNVFYFTKLVAHLVKYPALFPLVRAVGIGGSPVPEHLVHALQQCFSYAECYIIYGSSEAEPIAIRKVDGTCKHALNGYHVGEPWKGLEVRIKPGCKIQTSYGLQNAGEIEVRGSHVATLKKDGWLQTGDIGYLTPGQGLCLTARKGNDRPHQYIQHYQVEHFLQQQKGVDMAGVVSASGGFHVYIAGSIAKDEVTQILRMHLPPGIIQTVRFRTRLPVDARHRSKILYGKLR